MGVNPIGGVLVLVNPENRVGGRNFVHSVLSLCTSKTTQEEKFCAQCARTVHRKDETRATRWHILATDTRGGYQKRRRRRPTIKLICIGWASLAEINKLVEEYKIVKDWSPSKERTNKEAHALNGNRRRRTAEVLKLRQSQKNIRNRITTINTAGFAPKRVWEAVDFMRNNGVHLLVLTETHTNEKEAKEWEAWASRPGSKHGVVTSFYRQQEKESGKTENKKKGVVAIWYKGRIDLAPGNPDHTGRWVELKWGKTLIWGAYAPATKLPSIKEGIHSEGYQEWWRNRWNHVKGKKGLIIGDFNWAPSAEYTSSGKVNSLTKELKEFSNEQGWIEKLDPENKWTFVSKSNANNRSTLDRVIGSKKILTGSRTRVHKEKLTPQNDHWPVSITWYKNKKKNTGGQRQFL
jgi:exonuclease III